MLSAQPVSEMEYQQHDRDNRPDDARGYDDSIEVLLVQIGQPV